MRVAFALDGDQISAHFGHCAEYALVDIEGGEVTAQSRVATPPHQPGALPPFLHRHGANCVVAGGMGPRAVDLFEGLGIQVVLGVGGPFTAALEALLRGELAGGASTCGHGDAECAPQPGRCHQ